MSSRILGLLDRAAGFAALRLLEWTVTWVDPARREWVDAVRGEIESIQGGRSQLAWALGGVRLAVQLRIPVGAQVWRRMALSFAPVAVVGVLVMAGTSAAVNAASQPDPQCTTAHTPSSEPPLSLVTAADYLALGDFDYDSGACEQAIVDYTRAIALDPQLAAAFNNRAYTLMRMQDYATALPDLDRAIELRPDYSNALMNRGDIHNYYYQINRGLAVADYDRVLAIGDKEHTGVCGHRLLAYYDGWSPGVAFSILTSGVEGGCQVGRSGP